MATALYKASFFYELANRYGFSDSFYQSLDDTTSLNVFAAKAAKLMWRRACLMNSSWKVISMRVSREGVFRDSRLFFPQEVYAALATGGVVNDLGTPVGTIPIRGRSDQYSTIKGPPTEAAVTLLLRGEAGEFHRRELQLHGIDEELVNADNSLNRGSGLLQAALTKFSNEILNFPPNAGSGPWQVRTIDAGQPIFPVVGITTPDSRSIILTSNAIGIIKKVVPPAPPADITVGDYVQVRGVRGCSGVNGIWRVNFISAGPIYSYTLIGTANHLVSIPGGVTFQRANIRYYTIAATSFDTLAAEDISERDVGRPSNTVRGRHRRG